MDKELDRTHFDEENVSNRLKEAGEEKIMMGSKAFGSQTPTSDIDIVVQF